MLKSLFCLFLVIAAAMSLNIPPKSQRYKWNEPLISSNINTNINYRLPNNTKPESYNVLFRTNIHESDFTFTGEVEILLRAQEDTEHITLHYRDLEITDYKIRRDDQSETDISNKITNYDNVTHFFEIFTKEPLIADQKYLLHIKYKGILRPDSLGVFRGSYLNEKGDKRWFLTTQFSENYARHAFPCYDEPALKARFSITIIHDQSYRAISNMPETKVSHIENFDGTITTVFESTPLMSTYLTAFAVSDFPMQSLGINRVFSQPKRTNHTNLALDFGGKILSKHAQYFNIPYSLPKMDQFTIPVFNGAMENWGLVVYAEDVFYYNKLADNFHQMETVLSFVSHEFAHQWFGNLISPSWWTYIWLSEGFAEYFEYKGIDLVYPDMGMMDLYVVNNVHSILNNDARLTTRPMTHYVEDPEGVSQLFDFIAYGKSGSVIRMFSHAFTEASFKKGLNYYLMAKEYSDAAEEDLFENLEEAVKEDKTLDESFNVETIMKSWTHAKGFPILNVTVDDEGIIEIDQKHYLNAANEQPIDHLWWIPYNFVTANDEDERSLTSTAPDGWLNEKTKTIRPTASRTWTKDDWVVFNKEHSGYYRVMYDSDNYKKIGDALAENKTSLHHLTKAQLLDDVSNFIDTGRLKFDSFLNLVRLLKYEREYAPWVTASSHLSLLNKQLVGSQHYHRFETFIRDLVTDLYNSTGIDDIEDEPHLVKYSRNIALNWACAKGLEDCLDQSTNRLKDLITNGSEIHQNVRPVFFCAALRSAEEREYRYVWSRALATEDTEMRNILMEALSCTKNEDLLKRFVRSTLNSTNDAFATYRDGEPAKILTNTYQNSEQGLDIVMNFVKDNAEEIRNVYNAAVLQALVNGIGLRVTTEHHLDHLKEVLEELGDTIDQKPAIDAAEANIKWNEEHLTAINDWIDENLPGGAAQIALSILTVFITSVITLSNYF